METYAVSSSTIGKNKEFRFRRLGSHAEAEVVVEQRYLTAQVLCGPRCEPELALCLAALVAAGAIDVEKLRAALVLAEPVAREKIMRVDLEAAKLDTEYQDKIVREVERDENGWAVTFDDGWGPLSLLVLDASGTMGPPVVGDTLRLFGPGLFRPVRGIGRVLNGELVGLWRYKEGAP
jgi:hypothetical protein